MRLILNTVLLVNISEVRARHAFGAEADQTACEEWPVWSGVGAVWRQLYGSFRGCGVSFEWHEFQTGRELDWAKSFHASSVEICLNLSGSGFVRLREEQTRYRLASAGFYAQGNQSLEAKRLRNQRHQFITVEFASNFLARHLSGKEGVLHPLLRQVVEGKEISGVSPATPLSAAQQTLIADLRNPPVHTAAQPLWYEAKAMELMAQLFVRPPAEQEFFCTRQKRLAKERVKQAIAIVRRNLVEPPSLEEIGREVGCSPFYLSRTFSKEMGVGIPQYLRQLRMEKAAELLKSGEYNVTEAAFEVGYSSLSHFSQAFHQTFGCCPGLYPVKTVPFAAHVLR
ncbi:MAG: AraC family transcriptional regulator [Verrucomicrobiota bacterium]